MNYTILVKHLHFQSNYPNVIACKIVYDYSSVILSWRGGRNLREVVYI